MKLIVEEGVYDDLVAIVSWYESQVEGLGKKFLDEWENELKTIARNPFIFQIQYKEFRQSKIKGFPYHIIFEIESDLIVVYSVFHAHRNPRKRYRRK